jgi:hypothetical protein
VEALEEAVGRTARTDPVVGVTGGPAGNARLTAWAGLLLLGLFAAELVTLADVRGLITWHLVIGALLIPPALVKTAATGWRIVRYYTGRRPYRVAGPPPLLLRVLGPLVVATTLALLGTGILLVVVGPGSGSDQPGRGDDGLGWRDVHQAAFVVWAVVTGLHVVARLVLAVRLTVVRSGRVGVPGGFWRLSVVLLSVLPAAGTAIVVYGAAGARGPSKFGS